MAFSAASKKILPEMFVLDTRALALFRIALGLLTMADLVMRSFLLSEHYTATGVLPLADLGYELPGGRPFFPDALYPHTWFDTVARHRVLFVIHGLAAFALVLGFRARAMSCVVWFLLVSLHGRNPTLIYGADDLLRLLLMWSIFLPLGRYWSLDAWFARRGRDGDGKRGHLSWAGGALSVQVACVYLFTWFCKSGPDWFQGNAVYYALHMDVYARGLAHSMRAFPELLRPLSLGVFWFELAAPLLLLSPVKTYRARCGALVGLAAMQIGFACFLSLGLFPWIALAALLPLVRLPGFHSAADMPASQADEKESPKRTFVRRFKNAAAAVLLVHVLLLNLGIAERVLPARLHAFLTFGIRLDQTWCMFSPEPGRVNEWDRFVIESRQGRRREVFPIASGPGLRVVYDRDGGRRRDYFTELDENKHRLLYAKFLCREHRRDFSEGIGFVEIRLVGEDIPPPGKPVRAGDRVRHEDLLLRWKCLP